MPEKNDVTVLIPAAGSGQRLGLGPKAFLPLGDSTILGQTLRAFNELKVIVAVSDDMLGEARAYETDLVKIIVGGTTRQETVSLLLAAASTELVLIHDAARPFLSAETINQSITLAQTHGAVSVVKTVADSLLEDGATVDRERLRAVQTPQTFGRELLLEAHQHALQNKIQVTDDAALVRLLGHEVELLEGDAWLDKITTPADYERAQVLVNLWRKDGA